MAALLLQTAYQTGAGSGHSLAQAKTKHGMQVTYTDANASITALEVELQGTLESLGTPDASANWYTIGTLVFDAGMLSAKAGMATFVDVMARRVRANIKTITGATSVDAVKVIYEEGAD